MKRIGEEEIRERMKKFINQKDMKQTNTADVFGLIRKCGRITRRQIADKTQLSWGAVSTITARLIEEGYVVEVKADEGGVGRTPYYLEVDVSHRFALGVDVNCSGFRAVLMNLRNEVVDTVTAEADMSDREHLLSGICRIIERAMALAGDRRIICIGIAMQGIVDSERGISVSLGGCRGWEDVPLSYILEGKFGLTVHVEHDPNCILYALQGHPRKDIALVRIDRGIGMAVMLGGRIIDKPGIFELGHTVVRPDGEKCSCGRRGCLELYASMSGMERLSGLDFSTLAEKARAGDADAVARFDYMAKSLSLAAVNAAMLMGLESLVLCGDMCEYKDLFFSRFEEQKKILDPNGGIAVDFADVGMAAKGSAMLATRIALSSISPEKDQNDQIK